MTAEQRLRTIAEVIRDRGFYAMGLTDGAALEALIAQAAGRPPVAAPTPRDELERIARKAFRSPDWRM